MSASVRVGAGAGSSAASSSSSVSIPANARKVVQDLKEIVKNSDDEIYAMLKECNMDPNETVQRLLSQDTFHEVKRKRDKKKENASKEPAEARTRAPGIGPSMRGGRARGRGNYGPRHNSEFSSGGRGQLFRDNGLQQNGRVSSMVTNPRPPTPSEPQSQSKASSSRVTATTPGSGGVPNGSVQCSRVVQGTQNNWGPGQATMAGILKAGNAVVANAASAPPKAASEQPLYPPDGGLSSVSDPVLHAYADSHTTDSVGAKQNMGVLGPDRSTREITPFVPTETVGPSGQLTQARQTSAYGFDAFSSISDAKAVDSEVPSTSMPSSLHQDLISPLEVSSEVQMAASPITASQFNGRVANQGQLQTLGSEKGSVEWRPKSPVKGSTGFQLFNPVNGAAKSPASSQDNMELLVNSTTKLQQLNIHEDQPVIIPDHLQVPEADRTHLSFGSFGEDFDANSNFVNEEEEEEEDDDEDDDEDDKKSSVSEVNNLYELHDEEAAAEQPTASSLVNTAVIESYNHQASSSVDTLVAPEDVKINIPVSSILPLSQAEVPKAETVIQQTGQHPIMSAMHGYTSSAAAVPQIVGGQFTYETPEPQTQEVSRGPSFMSYSDPSLNANYYNPVFRPSSDLDARYTQFVSAGANKYGAGIPVMTGQALSSSQDGGSSMVLPTTGPAAGQASQTVGLAQGALTIPPQHIPIHGYPAQHAGVPLTPFGANVFGIHYVPPNYGYMHSPYQHSYAGNTGYPQAPGSTYAPGSNFTPGAGAAYTSAGAAAMKYALPQYKPGAGVGNAPHAALAAGYGNFGTSPSGFTTMNSAVTSGTASGYEDVSGPQFKDNNLYIPSQQPSEGSAVWMQNPPSRDMAGMQTNSYYNLLNHGQHTSFAHTQPMHAVPAAAYASLYHQSQSGSTPAVHQLLQQPQALGAVGGVGAQSGAYHQQQQRGQQLSWTPNY